MSPTNPLLVVVAGPTAVGKTALAIEIAKRYSTEIVSADSRQIYREMEIGTAKPSKSELEEVPHHFINSHSIHHPLNAAQYGEEATELINSLLKKHHILVLCGGSGLYIKGVCEGFDEIPEVDIAIRQEISQEYKVKGLSWLQKKLLELDPEYYSQVDRSNPARLIRALEVKIATGFSLAHFHKGVKREHAFRILKLGVELDRTELYSRIDLRMDKMISEGLFDEAQRLYTYKNLVPLQTVGYQEIFDLMDNKYDYAEAVRLLKRNSRRYAKRQLTWFKRDMEIRWFHPDNIAGVLDYIGDSERMHSS